MHAKHRRILGVSIGSLAALLVPAGALAQVEVPEGGEVVLEAPAGAAHWAWDLDGGGAYDDCEDEPECSFSAEGLDGPSETAVWLWSTEDPGGGGGSAVELTIQVVNVAPEIVSGPPTSCRVGGLYVYALEVSDPAGELDPIRAELVEDAFPAGMSISDEGEVTWTPAPEQLGDHRVELHVDDGDEGTDTQSWTITVRSNSAPSAPVPRNPLGGECVFSARPFLSVRDALDPDGDALFGFFQVDYDPGFRSGGLQESPAIALDHSGSGSWQVQSDLADDSTYYWRTWASDGILDSDRVVEVLTTCYDDYDDDDYYYDYDDGDGRPGARGSPSGGCGCMPERPAGDSDAAGLGPLALVLLVWTRRRSR